MLGNVLLRAFERIATRQVIMDVARGLPEEALVGAVEHVAILQEEAEKRRQVIRFNVAIHIGRSEANRAALHGLGNDLEIVEAQRCVLAGIPLPHRTRPPVGEDDGERAVAWIADEGHPHLLHQPGGKMRPRRSAGSCLFDGCFCHFAAWSNYRE
ncbi:hypothetical protein D3C87_1282670 [compost metagenome]